MEENDKNIFLFNYMDVDKNDEIFKKSNPEEVQKKAFELLGDDAVIYRSNREKKKYAIFDPLKQRYSHFGDIDYEDYTYHKDDERRKDFRKRNMKWYDAPMYSPAFLAYHLLW